MRWRNPDNGRYGEVIPDEPYERGGSRLPQLHPPVYIDGRRRPCAAPPAATPTAPGPRSAEPHAPPPATSACNTIARLRPGLFFFEHGLAIRAATWRNPAAGRAAARLANHPFLYADECAAWRLQTTTPFGGEPWRTKRLRRLQAQALQRNGPARRLSDNSKQEELVMDGKSLLIGVLLVGSACSATCTGTVSTTPW